MKDLVTLTCNKERHLLLLQAESIQKFLEPCIHWIVVNEKNVNIESWEEILNPFYDKHELQILTQEMLFENKENIHGFNTQQVCKLAIAKLIKDDYLILDSKNLFIKPTSIKEWDDIIGSGIIEFIDEPPENYEKYQPYRRGNDKAWTNAIAQYKNMLNVEPSYFLMPITPFKIEYDILEKSNLLDDIFYKLLFVDNKIVRYGASEFILYSFLANHKIIPGKNTIIDHSSIKSSTLSHLHFEWYVKDIVTFEHFNTKMSNLNLKVLGIHRNFLKKCGPEHIKVINKYLKKLEFNFQFI